MEIILDIQIAGKKYSVPLHPQHDARRLHAIERHLHPLMEYIKGQFKDKPDTLYVTWNDNGEVPHEIFSYSTSPDGLLAAEVTQKMNEFIKEHGWSWQIP
jgi:hypothetical protein